MKVWIITMAFPCPSETFANNDVLTLQKTGVDVAVHGLRPKHRLFSQLVAERRLSRIWITHNSIENTLRGLWLGFRQPLLLLNFIGWIAKHTWKKPRNFLKSLTLVPRSFQIYDLARQKNPDVIYLYWSHYPALVGYLIQRQLPHIVVSISFVAHDVYYAEFDAKHSYTRSVTQKADVVQTITVANIPTIQQYGIAPEEIFLSYHGVDFNKIPQQKEKIKHRIVTAGRLIPDKGFDDVLRCFSQVLRLWSDASLVILGDGEDRDRLEALAQSLNIRHAVEFRGLVSHEVIFKEMASAEVFLFMSKAERLPNVVKEAMACHCVCVVSHTPGIEELVEDSTHGYVVPQGDCDRAVQCIHKLFSNPDHRSHMAEVAYQYLKRNFDLEEIIGNLKKRWQQLAVSKQSDSLQSAHLSKS